ncbi:MAG: hypothetical protein ACK56F_31145, partial [bacterium]
DGLSGGNSGLYVGERSEHLNSEEFRETFLRNDREGPTKAEKAGRWRKTTLGKETREEEIRSRVLQEQERPLRSSPRGRLEGKRVQLLEKPGNYTIHSHPGA